MKFNDLPEGAKEKVREENALSLDYDWWDCVEEAYKEDGKERGFDVDSTYFSGFSSQGDGACWIGNIQTLAFLRYHLKPENPQFAQYQVLLELTDQGWVDSLVCVSRGGGGHYSHQYTMEIATPSLGCYADDAILASGVLMGASVEELCESVNIGELLDDFQEWMQDEAREYAGAYYKALEEEYDWLRSDEAIIDRDEDYDEDGEVDNEPGDAAMQLPLFDTTPAGCPAY